MLYRRKETFRYSFMPYLPILFRISKIGDRVIHSSDGNAQLIDISPSGLKIQTVYEIPIKNSINLEFEPSINENPLILTGQIVWRITTTSHFQYGIRLEVSPDLRQAVINGLKTHAKHRFQKQS